MTHEVTFLCCILTDVAIHQVLELLTGSHPLPAIILDYRSKHKLLNDFVEDICRRARERALHAGETQPDPVARKRNFALCSYIA